MDDEQFARATRSKVSALTVAGLDRDVLVNERRAGVSRAWMDHRAPLEIVGSEYAGRRERRGAPEGCGHEDRAPGAPACPLDRVVPVAVALATAAVTSPACCGTTRHE